MTLNVIPFSCL